MDFKRTIQYNKCKSVSCSFILSITVKSIFREFKKHTRNNSLFMLLLCNIIVMLMALLIFKWEDFVVLLAEYKKSVSKNWV